MNIEKNIRIAITNKELNKEEIYVNILHFVVHIFSTTSHTTELFYTLYYDFIFTTTTISNVEIMLRGAWKASFGWSQNRVALLFSSGVSQQRSNSNCRPPCNPFAANVLSHPLYSVSNTYKRTRFVSKSGRHSGRQPLVL